MNYSNTIKLAAISLIASSFLVGCGSDSSKSNSTTSSTKITLSGVASDPEIQGANVYLDANANGSYEDGELNTTTDASGNYTLEIPKADIGKTVIVEGGVDKVTKEDFEGQLTTIVTQTQDKLHITPLTTLVQKYQLNNPNLSLDDVKSELATKLGLSSEAELLKNTAEDGNENLLAIALTLEKVAELVEEETTAISNSADVYVTIATQLQANETLETAINATVDNLSSLSDLAKAKAKDLVSEISQLQTNTISTEALALSVENIDDAIAKVEGIHALSEDLYTKAELMVNDGEVKAEQEKRLLENLGLSNLTAEQKEEILSKIDLTEANHKLIDIAKLSIDSATKADAKRDEIFHKLGLDKLDEDTLDTLKTKFEADGFDFVTATKKSVFDKINDTDFLGDNYLFNTKVKASMSLTLEV